MSLQVEKQEKNMAVLTIEVPAEDFEAAIEKAYQKNKGKIQIPGFRKGKVPRRMIEQMYGKGFFYEDAANSLIPDAYEKALEECEETIVSSPRIDVKQIEGNRSSTWILMDYEDIIVHLFSKEDRLFYNLERIWQDGVVIDPAEL